MLDVSGIAACLVGLSVALFNACCRNHFLAATIACHYGRWPASALRAAQAGNFAAKGFPHFLRRRDAAVRPTGPGTTRPAVIPRLPGSAAGRGTAGLAGPAVRCPGRVSRAGMCVRATRSTAGGDEEAQRFVTWGGCCRSVWGIAPPARADRPRLQSMWPRGRGMWPVGFREGWALTDV